MKVKIFPLSIFICIFAAIFFLSPKTDATSSQPLHLPASASITLPLNSTSIYRENNITSYLPCTSSSSSGTIKGGCGGEITTSGNIERTKEMVEKYGTLAMNLQITYGVSWELIIAQMVAESEVGTTGTAVQQAKDGLYNWMGLSTCNINGGAKYATGKTYARPADEGCYYESYESIEMMMKSYASGDYLRNGAYDEALKYTDKDNYDLKMYNKYICNRYVLGRAGVCPDSDSYVVTTMEYVNYIREKAKELNYPTTEELQKQKNIPIGGKYPIGTSRTEIYDDSVTCGDSTTASTAENKEDSDKSSDTKETTPASKDDSSAGLTFEQAKQLAYNYGANIDDDSRKTAGSLNNDAPWVWDHKTGNCFDGNNCVTFSRFFTDKFATDTPSIGAMGDELARAMHNKYPTNAYSTSIPIIYSIFSSSVYGKHYGGGTAHTGIVVGREGDNYIVAEAACGKNGHGAGDLNDMSYNGPGFGYVEKIPSSYLTNGDFQFFKLNVDESKLKEYINSSGSNCSGGDSCPKLAELRKEIWDEASQEDKEYFIQKVYDEDYGLGAIEAYMNQIVAYGSRHGIGVNGSDGTIHNWLYGQCKDFGGGKSCTATRHTITAEDQELIDQALAGSNNIKFAVGNATGGSGVGAGKIVCVWKDGKCRDDVNYDQPAGTPCSSFAPTADFGECWGMEMAEGWNEKLNIECGACTEEPAENFCETDNCSGGTMDISNLPSYSQCEWGLTDCSSKCGITSLSELIAIATGDANVTPPVIDQLAGGKAPWNNMEWDFPILEHYNLEYKTIEVTSRQQGEEVIKKYLSDGWLIHTGGNYGSDGHCVTWQNKPPYSISNSCHGHIVTLVTIDGDKVLMSDAPAANSDTGWEASKGNHWYTIDELFDRGLYPNGYTFSSYTYVAVKSKTGISGTKSSSSSNSSGCSGSGAVGEDGLTYEQAKQLAMNYGANKNGSSLKAAGAAQWYIGCSGNIAGITGGSNCVTFSAFFSNMFGKQSHYDSWGDGISTVDDLSGLGVKTGTEPKVWSVFSGGNGHPGHTGVIVGHHGNNWIVIQASCSNVGGGKGDGTGGFSNNHHDSAGSAWAAEIPDLTINNYGASIGNGAINTRYAYLDVDAEKVKNYLDKGE